MKWSVICGVNIVVGIVPTSDNIDRKQMCKLGAKALTNAQTCPRLPLPVQASKRTSCFAIFFSLLAAMITD